MAPVCNSVLIWGAGGHGRVVAEIARAAGWTVFGFIDAAPELRGRVIDAQGARVVMSEAEFVRYLSAARKLPDGADAVIPAVGDNRIRMQQLLTLGAWAAPPAVHPSAVISPSAELLAGTAVCPLAVVHTNARVGRGVIINTAAVVGHDCVVADAAHIGARAVLNGAASVGTGSFVAAGAILLPGVRLGANAVLGAGAVALRDLADGVTAAGVPAQLIESRGHGNGKQPDLSVSSASLGA